MDLIGNLPREIAINILSRLPIPSIIKCKVVCKAWRDLIKCREFCNGHKHRHLVSFPYPCPWKPKRVSPRPYKIEELNDIPMGMSIIHTGLVDSVPLVRSSVDGLILLLRREWEGEHQHFLLWVCNPITREYVRIPNPLDGVFRLGFPYPLVEGQLSPREYGNYNVSTQLIRSKKHKMVWTHMSVSMPTTILPPPEYATYNFGFGVSRSKQYKVVWISQFECRVYTLGTMGQWRSIPVSGAGLRYNKWNTECESVGGNLCWLDPPESQTEISCFDLETEVFTYFSAPPLRGDLNPHCHRSLCVSDDCLCLCDVYGEEMEIWLMRRHGDWSKKVVIDQHGVGYGHLFPIKVLEDYRNRNWNEMILGTRIYNTIYYYCTSPSRSIGTRITRLHLNSEHRRLGFKYDYPRSTAYTPSFLPLKTLLVDMDEDVRSF